MTKLKWVQVRISVEDHDFIKKMGSNFSDIWQIGFEKWSSEYPDFLQKKIQEYQKLSIQCNDKIKKCNDNVLTKTAKLDEIYDWYTKTEFEYGIHRSLENPTNDDKKDLEKKLNDKQVKGFTIEQVFDYFKRKQQEGNNASGSI